jgi:putative phosphoribosyl transferase
MQAGPNAGVTLRDRQDAGQRLSDRLGQYRRDDTVVVAIPRGGVLVAYEVAHRLGVPLEVLVVEKIATSEDPAHALGGVAGTGRVLDFDEVHSAGRSAEELRPEIGKAGTEAERRELDYREGRPPVRLGDRTVLLIMEGITTPVLARAAVQAIRAQGPRKIVLATGVCLRAVHQELRRDVDELIVLREPEYVVSVGEWYQSFPPVGDDQVREALRASATEQERRRVSKPASRTDGPGASGSRWKGSGA